MYLWKNGSRSVYEEGVSGNTTIDLLKRFSMEAKARYNKNDTLIIFSIGINDSVFRKSLDDNYVKLDKFQKNLNDLYTQAKKFSNQIIFTGTIKPTEEIVTPAPWAKDFYYYRKNAEEYNNEIKNFCTNNNLTFIELFNLLEEDDFEDGLHPNAKGHEKIFEKVKDELIKNKII